MEVALTSAHWAYLACIAAVIVLMVRRRDVVLVCLAGSFIVGLLYSRSPLIAIQSVFSGLLEAGTDLFDIMLIIALMVAMLHSLSRMGADYLMVIPLRRFMKTPTRAFFILGATMYAAALFFWPTPATALVGTILVPVAIMAGLPAMGAAMAVNILGHGMALSGDLVIQGALKLSSGAAGVTVDAMLPKALVLSLVSGLTAGIIAFLSIRKDIERVREEGTDNLLICQQAPQIERFARLFALAVPLTMLTIVVVMASQNIRGGKATALLGGTALLLLFCSTLAREGHRGLEEIVVHLRHGFLFAIKIFSPVIPIAGFFFLGSQKAASQILGDGAPGFLFDLGRAFANALPLGKIPLAFGNLIVGIITGLDGSGFSGLPLTGCLAQALGAPLHFDVAALATIGQMGAIWGGGGTLVAWSFGLVATAGVSGVDPMELARRNFIPVTCGLLAATIVGICMM